MKIDFHSHFLDASAHNDATTFDHMIKFIHWMYENKLFINDSIVYDNMDGYSNQCICANEKWI